MRNEIILIQDHGETSGNCVSTYESYVYFFLYAGCKYKCTSGVHWDTIDSEVEGKPCRVSERLLYQLHGPDAQPSRQVALNRRVALVVMGCIGDCEVVQHLISKAYRPPQTVITWNTDLSIQGAFVRRFSEAQSCQISSTQTHFICSIASCSLVCCFYSQCKYSKRFSNLYKNLSKGRLVKAKECLSFRYIDTTNLSKQPADYLGSTKTPSGIKHHR